jgi:hypothetical protein
MSLLLRILGRVALGLGWVTFAVLGVLYLVEETGLLTHLTRNWIATHLGALGADLEIEHVKLRWFRPAMDLYSVRLGRDGEMVLVRHARVSPEAFNGRGFALSGCRMESRRRFTVSRRPLVGRARSTGFRWSACAGSPLISTPSAGIDFRSDRSTSMSARMPALGCS